MNQPSMGAHQKAVQINLDKTKYGTFAEIGAGQEVARWFFRVGGASGTIAKTISAYDMIFSDAIYGRTDRYVSRQRLYTMLDHEYDLLLERLRHTRGSTTRFFVFANTVAAQSYVRREECHGWMGVRFQTQPNDDPSEVIIHVRLLDKENLPQQEAIGVLGVNLLSGALYSYADPQAIIASLRDDLAPDRVEVDMVKFSGPAFANVDNRLLSLQLVRLGLANAAMFTARGEVVQSAEMLHKKAILLERGRFQPVTRLSLEMLQCAQDRFLCEPGVARDDVLVLMEMTLHHLMQNGEINDRDFLDRVDILGALGQTVLISNYGEFHRLASYLFRYTKKKIGLVMGVPTLRELFEEKYYVDLEGGILESFGRLFKNDLKIYAYPFLDPRTNESLTAEALTVAPKLKHLYGYLLENHFIEGLDACRVSPPSHTRSILEKIQAGDPSWEENVPPQVARLIKERHLLGYNVARRNRTGQTPRS